MTGREKTEPVLQNIPPRTEIGRELKKVFEPSPGSVFMLSCDYSQIELRMLAQLGSIPRKS